MEEGVRSKNSESDSNNTKRDKSWWDREGSLHHITRSESEEYIVPPKIARLEVWETKEVEVDRGSMRQFGNQERDPNNVSRMYDGSGNGSKEFETTTTVTAIGNGRKSESGSR
jgi:hypothetical protein